MTPLELVILDFDGTFTRVDEEAAPFLEAYRDGLGALLGGPIDESWERARRIIEADPDRFGWEYEGRIVAPSHADPYILATSIAQLLLREHGAAPADTEPLFREAYASAGTVFREDARAVVEAVLDRGVPVYVVTNSHTTDVRRKLERLGARGADTLPIRGDAQKWRLDDPVPADPRFDALPRELRVDGLARPIFVRRGRYFDALRAIWSETDTTPAGTLVCGDIFELDLALPSQLGARVHMVGREGTPAYERAAVSAARGTFSTELRGLLARLE
jgi:hypothetical protein